MLPNPPTQQHVVSQFLAPQLDLSENGEAMNGLFNPFDDVAPVTTDKHQCDYRSEPPKDTSATSTGTSSTTAQTAETLVVNTSHLQQQKKPSDLTAKQGSQPTKDTHGARRTRFTTNTTLPSMIAKGDVSSLNLRVPVSIAESSDHDKQLPPQRQEPHRLKAGPRQSVTGFPQPSTQNSFIRSTRTTIKETQSAPVDSNRMKILGSRELAPSIPTIPCETNKSRPNLTTTANGATSQATVATRTSHVRPSNSFHEFQTKQREQPQAASKVASRLRTDSQSGQASDCTNKEDNEAMQQPARPQNIQANQNRNTSQEVKPNSTMTTANRSKQRTNLVHQTPVDQVNGRGLRPAFPSMPLESSEAPNGSSQQRKNVFPATPAETQHSQKHSRIGTVTPSPTTPYEVPPLPKRSKLSSVDADKQQVVGGQVSRLVTDSMARTHPFHHSQTEGEAGRQESDGNIAAHSAEFDSQLQEHLMLQREFDDLMRGLGETSLTAQVQLSEIHTDLLFILDGMADTQTELDSVEAMALASTQAVDKELHAADNVPEN